MSLLLRRWLLIVGAALALCLVSEHTFAQSDPAAAPARDGPPILKVGVYNFKPLVFIDDQGAAHGFFVDLLDHIAAREGWTVTYVPGSWAQSLARLEDGEIDLLVSIGYSEEREKRFDFTREPLFIDWGQVYRRRGGQIESIIDLDGKTVSCLESSIYTTGFRNLMEQFRLKVTLLQRREYDEVLADVAEGRADAGISANVNGLLLEGRYAVERTGIVFSPVKLMFATLQGRQGDIIATIDRYVGQWKDGPDSFYRQKYAEWVGGGASVMPSWARNAAYAGSIAVLALLSFSLLLRRQVRHRTLALSRSERQYRDVVEGTPDLITRVDGAGKLVFVNHASKEIFGLEPAACIGLSAFDFVHPDDREATAAAFAQWQASALPEASFENRQVGVDGRVRHTQWKVRLRRAEDGRVIDMTSIARDVTESKRAEDRLRVTLESLTASNIELERFAYVASHDLREPVRTLVSFSQLLERQMGAAISEAGRESLNYIIAAARRMDALVQDLLGYARVATQGASFQTVDLGEAIANVLADLSAFIAESGAEITVLAPLPQVSGDKIQLHQLFLNLLSNSLKFRHPEEPPRITIASEQTEAWCQMSVTDNGIGVPAEYAEQIFEIFKRLHGPHSYPGTGMGLAIAKRIVERHNGRIWAEPGASGAGTAFHVVLPRPGHVLAS